MKTNLTRHVPLIGILLTSTLTACGDNLDPDPALFVHSPTRGRIQTKTSVEVTGRVTASYAPVTRVEVNGKLATLDDSGSFAVTLALEPGTHLIETIALAGGGGRARDIRAVSVGERTNSPVRAATILQLGNYGLRAVADELAPAIDLASIYAEVMNAPVRDEPVDIGCGPDTRDVISVVSMNTPINPLYLYGALGGLSGEVLFNPFSVAFAADYASSSCDIVSAGFSLQTDELHLTYRLMLEQEQGDWNVEIGSAGLLFDHPLVLDTSGLDPEDASRLTSDIHNEFADALVVAAVPELEVKTEAWLASLTRSGATSAIGAELVASQTATSVTAGADGLVVQFEASVELQDELGRGYIASPAGAPELSSRNAAMAFSDDAINQILAAVWALGGFDFSLSDSLELEMLIPPSIAIRAGEAPAILVGDWMARAAETEVAISGEILLAPASTAKAIHLSVERIELDLFRVAGNGLAEEQVQAAAAELRLQINSALAALAIEAADYAWPDLEIKPSFDGYVVVDTAL